MKIKNILTLLLLLAILVIAGGCGKGIEPEPENETLPGQTGFSGRVTFTGSWPAGVKRTHLVVSKDVIVSGSDFYPPNLAFVIDSIPYRSEVFSFNSVNDNFIPLFTLTPGNYRYIVVAQSSTPEISLERKDWTIVGIYNIGGDQSKPKTLTIENGKVTSGVEISVDFSAPPPQPPN